MYKEDVLQIIRESGVVAVIRGRSMEDAVGMAEACADAGIRAVEVAFTTPFAHRVLEELAGHRPDILLGAGTVLDPETARLALLSGASFIVSPHLNPGVVRLCNRYRIANMAGVMTVREAVEAMETGCDLLKLFPAGTLGPAFLRELRGPLPQLQAMPTGGVDLHNAGDWIRAGAAAVGAGGSLIRGDIAANAAALLAAVGQARKECAGEAKGR